VPDLSMIVVAYHNADLLQRCLSSLPPGLPVWVVDNSSDAAVKAAAAQHGAEYVDTGSNLGFAAGVNTGLRLVAPGSDVLLLNPDAELSADALGALYTYLRRPGNERLAAISPALVDPFDASKQRVRWPLPTPGRMWREALGFDRVLAPPDEYSVGAVLLLRRDAITDVGLFDERFFLYAEEADWERRALARGWRTAEAADIRAVHIGAGTSEDESYREALFHAGIETYMRKWYGSSGWLSYRAAAFTGAVLRSFVLTGVPRDAARARAKLYLAGPRRLARLEPRTSSTGQRVTHVVVTEAFAGVERYVSEVAREQAARGADVTVIGGDPQQMPAHLGAARFRPASTVPSALRALARGGRQDVVHVHMTAAELAAALAAPAHGAPIVSTRHIATTRGSTPVARLVGRLIRRRLALQIATSHYVAGVIGEGSTVLWNAVQSMPAETEHARDRSVLVLQRLEPEKATHVAIRAWAASGLASLGWELHIAGEGSQRAQLEDLVRRLHVGDSVRLLGHVRDTEVLLRRAGLLMATGTADAFGLSVAEAMAWGTPVLASDGGAHSELLGPQGWTFPVGDATAAAKELRRVAALSAEERTTYGHALRERQRQLFDLVVHVDHLSELYNGVIQRE
jgi:GT2 family glycosyltransferase/glycosyltransferase involved in cell wall biosynthesis